MRYADDWDFDHHPPCRGGCGELADECACSRIRAGVASRPASNGFAEYAAREYVATCRWRGCGEPVDSHGLCDVHLATL